jgi:hypothetical protein
MKNTLVIAVAGGLIFNSLNFCKPGKKGDLFLKADMKYSKFNEKKCGSANTDNCKGKAWRACKSEA